MRPRSLVNSLAQPLAPSFIHGPPWCRQDCYADVLLPSRGGKYSNAAVITHQVSQPGVSHNLSSNKFKGPVCKIQRHSRFPFETLNKIFHKSHLQSFLFFFCPEVCVLKNILLVFCIWIWILLQNNINILVQKNKTKILNETFKNLTKSHYELPVLLFVLLGLERNMKTMWKYPQF